MLAHPRPLAETGRACCTVPALDELRAKHFVRWVQRAAVATRGSTE